MSTRLIAGLGNPGKTYEKSRHNVGFLILEAFATEKNASFSTEKKYNADIAIAEYDSAKLLLAKPLTFMNNSGDAIKKIIDYYKINLDELLIVHDEIDLPFGTIRKSRNASAAGHNGVKSIIRELGTADFTRLRIGIEGRETKTEINTHDYVLMNFSKNEFSTLHKEIIPHTLGLIEDWLNETDTKN